MSKITSVICFVFCAFYISVEVAGIPPNKDDVKPTKNIGTVVKGSPDTNPPQVVGGYQECDPNDHDVRKTADFAAREMAKNSTNGLSVIKVYRAQKQVVAGLNYKLSMVVVPQCDANQDSCPSDPCEKSLCCHVTVYAIPWEKEEKLTDSDCKTHCPQCAA